MEKKLRQTDYFGVLSDDLYVLLPNTDDEDAEGVIARFKRKVLRVQLFIRRM